MSVIKFLKVFCAQNSWFAHLPPVTVSKLGAFIQIIQQKHSQFHYAQYYLEQDCRIMTKEKLNTVDWEMISMVLISLFMVGDFSVKLKQPLILQV
jgi:hypothetical protein